MPMDISVSKNLSGRRSF